MITKASQNLKEGILKVRHGFTSLKGSPSELWKAYIIKFLDSYSYFSISLIFTLFLSSEYGYSDISAGTIYGAYGALITVFGLCVGVLIDKLGVSSSLKLGMSISLLGKVLMFASNSTGMLLLSVSILALGNSLGIPVLTVGIRRYTTDTNQGFAFGLFYVIMNIGALLSGPTADFCTILYKGEQRDENDDGEENKEWQLSGYRLVILLGIFANVIACIVAFTMQEINVVSVAQNSINSDSDSEVKQLFEGSSKNYTPLQQQPPPLESFQPTEDGAFKILKETIRNKDFWRFVAVCSIMLNVRMIFRHLDATLPKYMVREFGENVAKGTIYAINPALIIILVPIVTAATTDVDPLVMLHHGSYITAASVFALVFSTSITSCVIFVVFLSIGEAIWSPRLYDYTMQVCKEGREGTYMALSSAPLFLAKLPVGYMSGYLLQKYCPEEGPRESKTMWLIIALTTAVSPILLTIFWSFLSNKDGKSTEEKKEDTSMLNENDGNGYALEMVKDFD